MNNTDVDMDEIDELIADITNNCDEFMAILGSDRNCIHCIANCLIEKGWSKRHKCMHNKCKHNHDKRKNN